MVLFRCTYALLLLGALPCAAQKPLIFDVSTVVVGSQRLETVWAFAEGKWPDAGPNVGMNSTDIHCYKRFGFCEVANASTSSPTPGLASVSLTSFDILRWNASEMIAVDSSPIGVVNTLRFDFAAKKVSLSSTLRGETRDKFCTGLTPSMTATTFLTDQYLQKGGPQK
jgi:hypothetical protein